MTAPKRSWKAAELDDHHASNMTAPAPPGVAGVGHGFCPPPDVGQPANPMGNELGPGLGAQHAASSIFARGGDAPVHNVPMRVINRPVPSELDEGKVAAFMQDMRVS